MAHTEPLEAMRLAYALHQDGRLGEAEASCRAALDAVPAHPEALHLLGVIAFQRGDARSAAEFMERAIESAPARADYLSNAAAVYRALGRDGDAERCYRAALAARPGLVQAHCGLGELLRASGRLEAAALSFRDALAVDADSALAHAGLGDVLHELGRHAEAVQCYRDALRREPDSPEIHNNLGAALKDLGRLAEAEASLRRALALRPDFAYAHSNLGNVLQALGRLEDARCSFAQALALDPRLADVHLSLAGVLRDLGRLAEAEESCRRALALKPDDPLAHSMLGSLLFGLDRFAEAERAAREALAIQPRCAEAHYILGNVQAQRDAPEDAAQSYRRALALRPQFAEAHNNLGNVLKDLGRLEDAERSYRAALDADPGYAAAHSNLLFTLNYIPGRAPGEIYAQYRAFGARFAPLSPSAGHSNAPDPERKLRIGYLSADLRAHSAAFFIEPVLAAHDRERFEIYCYYAFARPDAVTERLKAYADRWREVSTLTDEALANLVRADRIDILVDLDGHSAHNRLLVFARKPAPVQATWFGNLNTTGLAAMDWRITDAQASPEGQSERFHSERLMRLPASLYCYRPPEDCPEVSSPPRERAGRVTFGAFTNSIKIVAPAIELWGRLLERIPGSRLLVLSSNLAKLPRDWLERYGRAGIARERLTLVGTVPFREYLARHGEVDVMLDTFPCAGATTTCHALWMGVPVVSLAGDTETSRLGASLLNAIGLDALVARTPEQYLEIATGLALEPGRAGRLRAEMRERMRSSPLMDAAGFTFGLEDAYRAMWRDWCNRAS